MSSRKWLNGIRLSLGFLLAPTVVFVSLAVTLDLVLAHLGADPDGPAAVMLGAFVGMHGLILPYVGALFFGLPYILFHLNQGRLHFWIVMIPVLIIALVHSAAVYSSLCHFRPPHPLAEAVALPQVPAVIFAGLCFYFIGVWKPCRKGPPDDK